MYSPTTPSSRHGSPRASEVLRAEEAIADVSDENVTQLELMHMLSLQDERIAKLTSELEAANLRLQHEYEARTRATACSNYHAELLENVTDAIIATDLDFRITAWNRAAENIYGLRAQEAIGKHAPNILKTEFIGVSRELVLQSFAEKGNWSGEVLQQHNSGHQIVVMSSVNLVRNHRGITVGVVAVNRDITADRAAEEQLNTLSNAIEQSPGCVVITNKEGDIEYVNPAFTGLTGYTFEEVRGKNPRIIQSGNTPAETYQDMWRTILAGEQWQGELHNRAKDGRLFWEYARISPVLNRAGEIAHFIAVKEDITARKQREREQRALLDLAVALRDANSREDLLPAILIQSAHLVGAPVATFNAVDAATGRIAIEALLRHKALDTGLSIPLAVDEVTRAHVVDQGRPICIDDILLTKPGLPLVDFVSTERALLCAPLVIHGETLGVLCLLREEPFTQADVRLLVAAADMAAIALQRITLHEKTMRYAIDMEAEVNNRTRELATANERLKELDRLKSKFVYDVTHELRTPVTNIGLYLTLLQRKPEKLADYLGVLIEQGERLRVLVKDTLDLAKVEQGSDTLKRQEVAINDLTSTVVQAHSARAEAQGLKICFTPHVPLPVIWADRDKLTQVFTNLVANALNYTVTGKIDVVTTLEESQGHICVTVKDTGCGIHEDDLAHLFERFYRGSHDQIAPVAGTGLGLSIVKEIVQLHGGKIEVVSQVGEGSTFTVTLPVM